MNFSPDIVYVVLAIDENGHDQVFAVCLTHEDARKFCAECLAYNEFYDIWIEKHLVIKKNTVNLLKISGKRTCPENVKNALNTL